MKNKILFATTALVATASVAAADVTFSGYGRFGVKYSGSVAGTDAVAGEAYDAAAVTAASAAVKAALTAAGVTNSSNVLQSTTLAAQIDDLNEAINGTPMTVTAAATTPTSTTVVAATTGLVGAVAAAQAAIDLEIQNTGEPAASGTGSLAALETAQDNLAAAEAALAAIVGTAAVDAIASDTLITSRLLLDINASTETDSGVTYGAFVRVRQDDGDTNAFNAARLYVKTGGLEVAVGNIYGAMDSMPGAYGQSIGLTGLGFAGLVTNSEMTFSSKGAGAAGTKEAVEATYSMGDFSAHVSANGTDTEGFVAYSTNGWTIALATSDSDVATSTETAATVSGKIGDVTVGAAWAEAVDNTSQYTLSAAMSVGAATTVNAYYNDNEANTVDDKSYGIGFKHDMGAGTSLRGGIVSVNDQTMADFGVLFNF